MNISEQPVSAEINNPELAEQPRSRALSKSTLLAFPFEKPVISVVAPVFNEEALIGEFCARTTKMLETVGEPYEIVLINDGCRDSSPQIMSELHEQNPNIKVLNFSRNFGHQIAITAGMDYASGEAIVIIDSDLQDPPEVIPEMIAKWRAGYKVVYAVRADRTGETAFKLATAKLFYRLIHSITNVNIPVDTGDFRLMDKRVVLSMRKMREHHRFMRGMSAWVGFKQIGVPYHRAARKAGETKYPLSKMLNFAFDGITSFSYLPLQLATYLGFGVAILSIIGIFITIIFRIFGDRTLVGEATSLVTILFLGGIQLICIGIIGEYIGRIYDEVKQRPLYIVADALGLEEVD